MVLYAKKIDTTENRPPPPPLGRDSFSAFIGKKRREGGGRKKRLTFHTLRKKLKKLSPKLLDQHAVGRSERRRMEVQESTREGMSTRSRSRLGSAESDREDLRFPRSAALTISQQESEGFIESPMDRSQATAALMGRPPLQDKEKDLLEREISAIEREIEGVVTMIEGEKSDTNISTLLPDVESRFVELRAKTKALMSKDRGKYFVLWTRLDHQRQKLVEAQRLIDQFHEDNRTVVTPSDQETANTADSSEAIIRVLTNRVTKLEQTQERYNSQFQAHRKRKNMADAVRDDDLADLRNKIDDVINRMRSFDTGSNRGSSIDEISQPDIPEVVETGDNIYIQTAPPLPRPASSTPTRPSPAIALNTGLELNLEGLMLKLIRLTRQEPSRSMNEGDLRDMYDQAKPEIEDTMKQLFTAMDRYARIPNYDADAYNSAVDTARKSQRWVAKLCRIFDKEGLLLSRGTLMREKVVKKGRKL